MKKYEIKIEILNQDYVDSLIVALARQGYDVYINQEENIVCFTITDNDIMEIKI